MPIMASVLPILVVALAGAAITAISVRRVAAGRRWLDWQSLPPEAAPAPRNDSKRQRSCWTGWPVLAVGLLLVGNVTGVDATTPAAWTDIAWLALPLALAFVPPAADRSPPDETP